MQGYPDFLNMKDINFQQEWNEKINWGLLNLFSEFSFTFALPKKFFIFRWLADQYGSP